MSEPIKVGDLVMVVLGTPCCNHSTGIEGMVFQVAELDNYFIECKFCAVPFTEQSAGGSGHGAVRVTRLKRIPPLSELDGEKNREELVA